MPLTLVALRVFRSHPVGTPSATRYLVGATNLLLPRVSQALNRRLFSVVREQKRLTYDASIHLTK